MYRRNYLALSGAVTAGAFAGCLGDDGDTDDENGTDTNDDSGTEVGDEDDDQVQPEPLEDETLLPGEAVSFYTENRDKELAFRVLYPVVTNVLITDRADQGLVASEYPGNDHFLLVEAEMENTGGEAVDVPFGIDLTVDGNTYSHKRTALENEYSPTQRLEPGESALGTFVFDIDETNSTGELAVEWGGVESVTARWEIDLDEAADSGIEYEGLSADETLTIGTETVQYAISIEDVEEIQDPDEDEKDVFVTIRAENTGSVAAMDPTIRGAFLQAAEETFEERSYDGEDGFEVDEIPPEDSEIGAIRFRVPDSVDSYEFHIQLTMDLAASWEL